MDVVIINSSRFLAKLGDEMARRTALSLFDTAYKVKHKNAKGAIFACPVLGGFFLIGFRGMTGDTVCIEDSLTAALKQIPTLRSTKAQEKAFLGIK